MWADTVTLWRAPGLRFTGSSNLHHFDHPPLAAAFEALQTDEKRPGRWTLAERLTPFESIEGRGFPVVASFLRNGRSAPSSQNAEDVAARLAGAFSAATARGKS